MCRGYERGRLRTPYREGKGRLCPVALQANVETGQEGKDTAIEILPPSSEGRYGRCIRLRLEGRARKSESCCSATVYLEVRQLCAMTAETAAGPVHRDERSPPRRADVMLCHALIKVYEYDKKRRYTISLTGVVVAFLLQVLLFSWLNRSTQLTQNSYSWVLSEMQEVTGSIPVLGLVL